MGIYKSKNIYIAMLLVFGIVVMSSSINYLMKKAAVANISSSLGALLESTHESLSEWSDDHVWQTRLIAKDEKLIELAERLIKIFDDGKDLSKEPEQAALRRLLSKHVLYRNYAGFFLITPQGTSIASMRDENLGTKNIIYAYKDMHHNVFRDRGGITVPQLSNIALLNEQGVLVRNYPTMFVGAPVKDKSGETIAALAFRIDPTIKFTKIVERGRTGVTGETFAFSSNGLLLSETRFRKQLTDIGVLAQNQMSMLAVEIRDPGVDITTEKIAGSPWQGKPFTKMMQSSLSREGGENLKGYKDYRGIEVVGKWHWHLDGESGLHIGVAIEVDKEEAFAMLVYGQRGLFAMAAIACLLVFLLALHAYRNEKRLEMERCLLHDEKIKVEQSSRAKSSFMSSMSHELRTPLNAILGFTQLLELDAEKQFDNNQKECVIQILKAGDHLLELIEQVLELNKIEEGKMGVSLEMVEPVTAIKECISMVEVSAEERSIKIVNRIESDLPDICTDRTRFKQIVLNLLSNAVKYNRKNGSIEITDEIINGEILRISICDTGDGIPEDKKAVLFNPFERLGKEGGDIEGTGIGLTISKKIVEMMGGQIGFESKAGEGSCFWVDVPLN